MVALDEIQHTNETLQKHGPGLVGVFVGGNSGIGARTVKAFARHAEAPRIYILARNKSAAEEVLAEAKALNSSVQGTFIAVDASLLADVSRACKRILEAESYINLLVFTCGGFSATGRQLTSESLDRKLVLNYYARIHMTTQLLPHLRTGGANHNLASVISILGGGRESAILESDLALEGAGAYSLRRQFAHSIVSTDLMFEQLAARPENAAVRFVHQFPGYVRTKQVDGLGLVGFWTPLRWMLRGLEFLATPLSIPLVESGDRTLFSGVSPRYPARGLPAQLEAGQEAEAEAEAELQKDQKGLEEAAAIGSDGTRGSGAYILHWNGESGGVQSVLQPLRDKEFGSVVEAHFLEQVQRVMSMSSA